MSKSQRTKGAVFEREVCDLFSDAFGRKITRNIGQSRDGGNDIDVGCLVAECKRRASLKTLRGWMAQARAAVTSPDRVPVVVMREDGASKPMVLLEWDDFMFLSGDVVRESLPDGLSVVLPWKTVEGML